MRRTMPRPVELQPAADCTLRHSRCKTQPSGLSACLHIRYGEAMTGPAKLMVAAGILVAGITLGRAAPHGTKAIRKGQKLLAQLQLVYGAGSGLDADLLDGVGAEAFERTGGRFSTTVQGLTATTRILLDEMTGLE